MILEDFKFYKPCKLLQPYVRYYWVFKSNQPQNTLTFPIGCPQIIFHKQMPLYIPELNTFQDRLAISGQVNFPSHLYANPQTTVTELSSITCLCKKQFERLFHSLVGMNPKEYARIVRFQKALAQMQHQTGKEISQAQIAYASGYSDQSHFIREFKKLSGYTPMSLLKVSAPYSDLFTNPV